MHPELNQGVNLRNERREEYESLQSIRCEKTLENAEQKNRNAIFGVAKRFAELENCRKEFQNNYEAFFSIAKMILTYNSLEISEDSYRMKALCR